MKLRILTLVMACAMTACAQKKSKAQKGQERLQFSGIYPHLAYYNDEGECGTGAVVPWANRLWVITYGPHKPNGSSDKLYEITSDLRQIVRPESIGGTPANRMVHKESNQLFIGPYAIDAQANVRALPYEEAPGRHTGLARHLTNPAEKIYYGTMEEGFYEVDVNTLEPTTLYTDGNVLRKESDMHQFGPLLPGAHGKGLYSGQGVMVYSNNGEANKAALKQFDIEAGSLSEWDGKDWKVVRRNQFVEVTGPGGIYGNPNPETDPIWATGWDHKSVLVGVRNPQTGWDFYRLPKASHSYDGAHGWNTEWPRIRDIGTKAEPDYLMTMHGLFWRFPQGFTATNSAGIRPRSSYLKVIGDYTRWNDQLVFGCDDSAQKEFLNKRKVKGGIEGPGQSNSNLWFTDLNQPDELGPNTASGAVWIGEEVKANQPSEPFLFAGWPERSAWVHNQGNETLELTFEVDKKGNGKWAALRTETVEAGASRWVQFSEEESGEWVRAVSGKDTQLTVHFAYSVKDTRLKRANNMFDGITKAGDDEITGGLLYGLGDNRRSLGVVAGKNGKSSGYYELGADMKLTPKNDASTQQFIEQKFAIPKNVVTVDKSSVLVVDDNGRRWRLPKGDGVFDGLTNSAAVRICREVATERDLLNSHGTFYELPAENADGFAKVRPVASHNFRINDYASYRGLLVMTGIDPRKAKGNDHVIVSEDNKAAIWAGAIDDLWQMGKPTGQGGPWMDSKVEPGVASDPYLIGFYDKKALTLSHDSRQDVTFTIEVEPIGHGPWMNFREVVVKAGESFEYDFLEGFQARWIRFKADRDCKATAWLDYK